MSNGLVKTSSGPQKKGRTITFRVDDEVAEKLEKYAKMRNTSLSRVLRNWCESSDLRVELPKKARRKLESIARGRKRNTVGKLIEDAVKRVYWFVVLKLKLMYKRNIHHIGIYFRMTNFRVSV